MWVYSTSANADKGIRIFKYAPGRSGDNAKEFLKDLKDIYIQMDFQVMAK
jgi:transposase